MSVRLVEFLAGSTLCSCNSIIKKLLLCRRQIGQSRHVGLLFSITLASLPDKVEAMKQRRNVRTIRNGERERILIRYREALDKPQARQWLLAGFGAQP